MRLLKQSSTAQPLVFLMVLSSDHITGATGLTPTVMLSKNGGSFASPSGTVSEIANGWYQVAGNATDTATLGPLVLHASGTGADPGDVIHEVVAFDPQDATRFGLSALPNAAAAASGGLITAGTGSNQINPDGTGAAPIAFGTSLPTAPTANSVGEALFIADIMGGRINTAQGGTSTTITLDSGASSDTGAYVGDDLYLYSGTGGGIRGTGQRRTVTAYNTTTKVATVHRAWDTTPDNTTKFITLPGAKADVWLAVGGLATATAAGVLDTNAKNLGGASQTGADVGAQTSAASIAAAVWNALTASYAANNTFGKLVGAMVIQTGDAYAYLTTNLGALGAGATALASAVWSVATRVLTAGTNIALVKGTGITGFNDITASAAATAVWTDTTSSDFTQAGSIGKSLAPATLGTAPGASGGLFIAGSNAATTVNFTGNLSGSVGSVTTSVSANLTQINGTSIAGTSTYVAAAFLNMFNVASPALTVASVNQTGDSCAIVSNGTYGNAALATQVAAIPTSPPATVTLAASQPNYAPAKAGQQMDLVNAPNATAVTAIQNGMATAINQTSILDLMQADRVIDITTDSTQYHEVLFVSGTNTTLLTKKLYDVNGNKLNATSTVVGQAKQ